MAQSAGKWSVGVFAEAPTSVELEAMDLSDRQRCGISHSWKWTVAWEERGNAEGNRRWLLI